MPRFTSRNRLDIMTDKALRAIVRKHPEPTRITELLTICEGNRHTLFDVIRDLERVWYIRKLGDGQRVQARKRGVEAARPIPPRVRQRQESELNRLALELDF